MLKARKERRRGKEREEKARREKGKKEKRVAGTEGKRKKTGKDLQKRHFQRQEDEGVSGRKGRKIYWIRNKNDKPKAKTC